MAHIRVYLDNCCFNRPYDDQSQLKINMEALAKLEIQQQIRDEKIDLVTSYILVAENSANKFETKRNNIQKFIDDYTYIYVSEKSDGVVKNLATEIMNTGVKLMDACHIACAIISECNYFITTDKRLLKYESEKIKLVNPVTYILEMGDEQ